MLPYSEHFYFHSSKSDGDVTLSCVAFAHHDLNHPKILHDLSHRNSLCEIVKLNVIVRIEIINKDGCG